MAAFFNALAFLTLVWAGIAIGQGDFPVALFFGMPGGLLFGVTYRRGCAWRRRP
jgi:hypothetical protein